VGKREVNILLGMPRCGLKDNIKIILRMELEGVDWISSGSGQMQGGGTREHSKEAPGFRKTCGIS
jgi:hypothetical protein